MKGIGYLLIFLGVLAACQNREQHNNPPDTTGPGPDTIPGTASLRATGDLLPAGYMATLTGLSIRDPLQVDREGKLLEQSSLAPVFNALPVSALRYPAGSQSYKITTTADPAALYTLSVLLPTFPAAAHDFTWPPQLNAEDLPEWFSDRTRTISLANEPPIHADFFPTPEDYVAWARDVYDRYPMWRDHFAIQTGKPHIADSSPDGRQRQKHEGFLYATGAAVRTGLLPPRIYNTTKLYPELPRDWYALFATELERYAETHGDDIAITFGEWNYAEADTLSPEQIPACAAFLLVLARLRAEHGDQVFAANYQQGYAVGTSNVIALDGPSRRGSWVETAFTDFWADFSRILTVGTYAYSEIFRSEDVYLEQFIDEDGTAKVLYANRDSVAVPCDLAASQIVFYTGTNRATAAPWTGELPAGSAGIITLNP